MGAFRTFPKSIGNNGSLERPMILTVGRNVKNFFVLVSRICGTESNPSAGSFWNLASRKAMATETWEVEIKHKHLPPRLGDQQVFVITVKLSARNIG